MPTNKKKSNKKKKSGLRTMTGYHPLGNCCFFCNKQGTKDAPLLSCSRCGSVAFCGRECQRASYPAHRGWCIQTAKDFPRDDDKGLERLLFSRSFGGAVSLFMHYQQEVLCRRKGIIFAKCSHKLVDYFARRRTEDKRSITFSYVPKGEPLLCLQEAALGWSQKKRDDEGEGWLEFILESEKAIVREMSQSLGREDLYKRVCVVAVQQPGVQFLHTYLFVSYMGGENPHHVSFQTLIRDRRWENAAHSITLDWDWDWDWDTSSRNRPGLDDLEYPIQWLFYNAISPKFYNQCSLIWQKKRRSNGMSFFLDGELTPPLALGLNMTRVPSRQS